MNFGPTRIEIRFAPDTEEWAEDVIEGGDYDLVCERTDDALIVRGTIGGNCDAVHIAGSALRDLEEALTEGDISPTEVTVTATRESAA